MNPVAYIYVVTNNVNGKQYVGQTTWSVAHRWRMHRNAAARNDRDGCTVLYRAIRKYGIDAFEVSLVLILNDCAQQSLDEAERTVIKRLKTIVPDGYNLLPGGSGGSLHPDTKARLSAAHKGRRQSLEARAKMSAAHKGRRFTPEHKAKIGLALKGRPIAKWRAEKLHAACRGRPLSIAHRKKVVAALTGRPCSDETRAKMSMARLGCKLSPETKAKISAANKGRKLCRNKTKR